MTGFGRAESDAPIGRLVIEIQSVNRKYLEVFVSPPKELSRFEQDVRKWVGESVSRGQVSVRIFLNASLQAKMPNVELLKELKKGWQKVAKVVGTDPQEITLSFLLQYAPAEKEVGIDENKLFLQRCMKKALDGLVEMKRAEGKALCKDLTERLKGLEKILEKIKKSSPNASQKMRKKLTDKMNDLLGNTTADERVLKEIALFAEKVDIAEEITRFKSHVVQFKALLKGGLVGRKMDFLIQEMGREINTIGSKSMEAKISHMVVEMKSELEKIREQVQNIE
jgi:uncharacterized protein (TIGR00255 family)